MSKKIFISALEASAEKHCAALIKSVSAIAPDMEFSGIGGAKMAAAGCELLENTVSKAAMLYNVLGQLGYYKKLIDKIAAHLKESGADLVVVCDSPAFNFHVAKAAKKAGIPVMFYVAPQLWAWAPWRIHKLRRLCDKLCCILPFEEQWFRSRGVDAEFVGNPLFDDFPVSPSANTKRYDGYAPETARIVLLPGSRDAEIETLWKPMQEIALRLSQKWQGLKFTAVANEQDKLDKFKAGQIDGFACEYSVDSVIETALRSDLCICASGSVTLQLAAAGCPMVVMYQSNRLIWNLIGRHLIRIKQLSLPNIVAGYELVPEFMPCFTSTEPIAEKAASLIAFPDLLRDMSLSLTNLSSVMASRKTCDRVAEIALEMTKYSHK
jgi:lipid-A-disaccharide synthase